MTLLLSALVLLAVTSCGGDSPCEAPAGCLRVARVDGACACQEWQVVSVQTVPIKFVVVSVTYGAIGNLSELSYGWTGASSSMPPADSVLGSRLRAVLRQDGEADRVAMMVNADLGESWYRPLYPVTAGSADVLLAWGDGQGTGSAHGFVNALDAPASSRDRIGVWVNPTLTVTTDAAGGVQASFSWTSVGHCFWPLELSCEGPHVMDLPVAVLEGSRAPSDPYTGQFLATLTPAERAAILAYHPLYDPPGRDPASLAADPRFLRLGPAQLSPVLATAPSATWLPCQGTLTDDDPPLHEVELRLLGPSPRLFLQHAVLSRVPTCRPEQPGLALATSTPGCDMSADVLVDRMFGTLLFVPTAVAPSCTGP